LCKFPPNFFSCSSHLKDCFTPQSIASNAGTFTGSVVRLISDIRAKHGKDAVNLHSCGRFELAENPSDISDITHIDLSGIESLEGEISIKLRCSLQTKSTFEEFSVNVPLFHLR